QLRHIFRAKRRIVAFVGAGISVAAGVPDFSTVTGSSSSFKLFNASVYDTDESTESFHKMIVQLHSRARDAEPTEFHRFLSSLGKRGILTRIWSQNVDNIEAKAESLSPHMAANEWDEFPRTIQLHGTLDEMICQESKSHCFPFDPKLFDGPMLPECDACVNSNFEKWMKAKKLNRPPPRTFVVGKLRPNITLYEEYDKGPDIAGVLRRDLSKGKPPDCILIVGTRLKAHGARLLLGRICRTAKKRNKACGIIYVNKEQPSLGATMDSRIDFRVKGDCQDFA
ncbi:DHS-like NAD/FAD-binding domain-containing protein, partial [Zopfia rhizophila CBS 207.26]